MAFSALYTWNPIFAWLPIKSMIFEKQQEYYDVINYCNNVGNSTAFIEFMLDTIKLTVFETALTCSQAQYEEQVTFNKILNYCRTPRSRKEIQDFCGMEGRKKFNTAYLKPLLESAKFAMTIPDKPNSRNQKYYTV